MDTVKIIMCAMLKHSNRTLTDHALNLLVFSLPCDTLDIKLIVLCYIIILVLPYMVIFVEVMMNYGYYVCVFSLL